MPIGPKARHLNRDFAYASGKENQLEALGPAGILAGCAPAPEVPPVWPSGTTPRPDRSKPAPRAWLEINCAHCHNPKAPRGIRVSTCLPRSRTPRPRGVDKPPVAAGIGSGGLEFDIVPGQPDRSILAYRIDSTQPAS